MKLTFRWYGKDDPVTLEQIRQIPCMSGIVSAVYDVAPGGVWSRGSIAGVKDAAAAAGLAFEVVESVPVPEEIKLGSDKAPALIENYCENIRRLGEAGVKCICYNFMPVFDWLRSELEHPNPDGSNSLAYDDDALQNVDRTSFHLPGWDESYSKDELLGLLKRYEEIDEERLWRNLEEFLHAVIPVAAASGVKMAIHPDDPPWGMFGLPRVITCEKNLRRFLDIEKDEANGLTFCTGSLGASPANDLVRMADRFADRIHFLHLRNIAVEAGGKRFHEVAHPTPCGSIDMYGVARALVNHGWDGYVRPDHGRMIWGERNRHYGYGLYDRALGVAYIVGLFEGIEKSRA